MAGKKISQLNPLDHAADDDVVASADISETETKKIKKTGIVGIATIRNISSDSNASRSDFGKSVRSDTTSNITITYQSLDEDDDGGRITFINENEGKLTIQTADTDTVGDSGPGKTIYNNGSESATLTLEYDHSLTKLVIIHGHGTWTTTV